MKKRKTIFFAIVIIATVSLINLNLTSTSSKSFLSLNKVEALGAAEFLIKSNGYVGLFNQNPGYVMEIGASGYSTTAKINGNWINTSDSRIKTNIKPLSNSLETLIRLNSVSYNYLGKTMEEIIPDEEIAGKSEEEIAELIKGTRIIDKSLKGRKIYGFIAEEVREIFPELVYEDDSTGMLALDYTGVIPILVSSIQEQQKSIDAQQATINTQQTQIDELKTLLQSAIGQRSTPTGIEALAPNMPVLFQNNPNPFKERTEIRYSLPETVSSAEIYIFDMSGKLLKKYRADKSGVTLINGSELSAGLYTYSLIVDGSLVDTKKMILTK
jgi:hypothetical protein